MFEYCFLLSLYLIVIATFIYRVVKNYKEFEKNQCWTTGIWYFLSALFYSLLNSLLIYQVIEILYKVWLFIDSSFCY